MIDIVVFRGDKNQSYCALLMLFMYLEKEKSTIQGIDIAYNT